MLVDLELVGSIGLLEMFHFAARCITTYHYTAGESEMKRRPSCRCFVFRLGLGLGGLSW
jgi:hypothetical protein